MKLSKRRKFINHKKRIMYFSLFFLLLFISVGYAYLNAALSINGHTELSANTWNIHFENLAVTDGSVAASTPAAIQSDTTNIVYSVLLDRPGDFYEFEVDVVNAGTIGGKISLVNIQGISSAAEPYLEQSIKYTNGNPVQVDDLLNPGASKRIVVRVGYKEDLNSLPEDDIELDLELDITYTQTDEEEITTNTIIHQLKTENSSCFTKYEGQVTDQVGQTVTAQNVYFNKCADKRNIKFAGYCWQMIRTTETGGIKMVYNGEPVDGKCESTRGDHKGIVGADGSTQTLNAEYLYGSSFTYDTSTNEFTLIDTTTATWSDSTYENLLGKFTCKNTTGTCTTLYNVNGYYINTIAYTSSYTIGDTNYAQIGESAFNANYNSPAMVGYMFNKVYNNKSGASTSGSLMGNDVSYSNGTYTLLPANGESTLGTTKDATHHYTCNTTSSTCNKVRYYYYNNYYILLDGAENIQAAVNEMLYNKDVNTYNSSIKGIIDSWYAQNLSSKTNMLEDTVYCNARVMSNQATNGWNKDGSLSTYMDFKNYNLNNDLSCINITDQFAVSNNKAKLTYPVSLATHEELYTLTNNNSSTYYDVLTKTNTWWWGLSPNYFSNYNASVRDVDSNGNVSNSRLVYNNRGVRLVVTLSTSAVISEGSGTEANPWVVG